MPHNKQWARQWTILDSDGSGSTLTAEGSQFKLEPQPSDGAVLFYTLRAGTALNKCFDGRPFYPVGVRDLKVGSLPKWDRDDPKVRKAYLKAAETAKKKGRKDPLATRLEGTFKHNDASAVARIYYFKGVRQDGRDWIVFDIVTPRGSGARSLSAAASADGGDGTAHGDG